MTDQASTTDQANKTDQASKSRLGRRSRRQLLTRGAGTLAAVLAAEALTRPTAAAAADGDAVILGHDNAETNSTRLVNNTADDDVLTCDASGRGVGLFGTSPKGLGVFGLSSSSNGVKGRSHTGDGVHGESQYGTGVLAEGATALKVQGPAVFSRSGILTVAAGHSSAKKAGIALERASLVLATIQGNLAGVHVQGVTLVAGSSGSFTIHLNKKVSKNVNVAWFAVN